ncbi:tocopherol cyclase family protein [Clostridium sp. KNHs205]|uniref:tocopherol cyclase family protein n=1 Tax=Clostridium sp. KNHs205 TaxID=1449050 RepID=UPI00051C12D4|nr:tocopherol cyclase family protein [Clostridium sp. KNHs205]
MNKSDLRRNLYMLKGPLATQGYDWWWHNFTGYSRKTGEEKSFFIEYYVCNPALSRNTPILGQLPRNRAVNRRPSYALIKAGVWGTGAKQIHNFYPISEFTSSDTFLNVRIGNCLLTETRMDGKCKVTEEEAKAHPEYMCNAGTMEWDLSINKKISYHVGYGASRIFRELNAFEMFWHAEGIKTEYSGEVILDGEIYDVIPEKSYGYADKNWGQDFTSPWLWISSCDLKSRISGKTLSNSAVEFGGGRPKVFGIPMERKLLGGLYYEGKMYDYNFSRFWTGAKTIYKFEEGKRTNTWRVKAVNKDSELELVLKCPKEEMLLINYEAPNGKKLHNQLWNGGTGYGRIKLYEKYNGRRILIDEIDMRHTGCEYGEYDK